MKRIHLIINPIAGHRAGGRFGAGIAQYLRRAGCQVRVQFTRQPREAIALARAACATKPDCLAVAGGDGSLFEVANGLLQAEAHDLPLGLIPIGTGNDFAKMLNLKPHDWQAACDVILHGNSRRVDAGQVDNYYFVNGVGIGFDAQVALQANQLKWIPGNLLVYATALVKTLLHNHRTPTVRITHDTETIEQAITLLTTGNGRCHGGAFWLTPNADIADGLFDILIADAATRRGIIQLAPRVMRGTHLGQTGIRVLRSKHITISSEEPLVVHADGEIIDTAARALKLAVLPKALTLLSPAA
ncbi:MAG TPA: diacylglycerol kinase family protein [Gammaproteobacteria bacterium]|nr:diacylglycerol kinase family protein [Gammaproteobacteria bacterium]